MKHTVQTGGRLVRKEVEHQDLRARGERVDSGGDIGCAGSL